MKIICISCQARFTVPDEKIPKDKKNAFLRCPKCHSKVKIPTFQAKESGGAQALPDIFATSFMSDIDKKALVCVDNDSFREIIQRALTKNEFQGNAAENSTFALQFLEIQQYNAIIIDEAYDNGTGKDTVMEELERMDISSRRDICIVLLSRQIKTGDNMSTLHSSVNKVVNYSDMNIFENFFRNGIKEHKQFYSVYNMALRTSGKA
ncbi:MAG: zinc-ribbon domain-containing protein [Desulfobacteraceae bacterium]|nr:zinc-ribbon domain-containing protein [Desulfobacteraceae bacterium]